MKEKDPSIFLKHMIESIDLIQVYTMDLEMEDLLDDTQLQDSVIRRIEIIGEAVKNLPDDFRSSHDNIPWKDIAGMRDIVVHGYFGVDLRLIWNVVENDLATL